MIRVELYYDKEYLTGFRLSGHAGYADHGQDIVCSAVSVLVINTINAIEALTTEIVTLNSVKQSEGIIDCAFPKRKQGVPDEKATLLLEAMLMGLRSVEQMYGEYIIIKNKSL